MGTRAMISIDGKPMFATHWDSYPESLGKELQKLKKKDIPNLLKVASKHSINFADKSLVGISEKMMRKRLKGQAGYEWLFHKGQHFVDDIKIYGDYAEYQYDVDSKTGKIKFREISGAWDDPKKTAGNWKNLASYKKLEKVI